MLNNIKISSRLMLLLVFLLVGMALTAGLGLYASSKSNSAMKEVNDDRVIPIMQLNAVYRASLSSQIAFYNAISGVEDMQQSIQKITENEAVIDKQWQDFTALALSGALVDEEDRVLAAKFTEPRSRFVEQGIKPALIAMHANNVAALKGLLVDQIAPQNALIKDALNDLIEMQMRDAQKAYQNSASTFSSMRTLSILLSVIGAVLGGALGISIIWGINRSVSELHGVMVKMSADGDLNVRAQVFGQEEVGQASTAFNGLIERFAGIMREIEDCSRNMGQSSCQVATISNEISVVSKQQESRSEEVVNAMQQLHQISSSVQVQAIEASDRSRQVEGLAREGIENVRQNIVSMEETTQQVSRTAVEIQELEQSAVQIHDIVKTIKEIAGQTNLLALNAAIEAARAGEQGRGFAVVADEVRKLAERTTNSATDVSDIIGKLSGKVQQVAGTMHVVVQQVNVTQERAGMAATSIEGMASHAVKAAQVNQGISDASQQQLVQFELLNTTLETLFSILKESGAKVDVTAAIGDDLRVVTGRLNQIMSGFKFANGIMIEAAQHEKRRVPRAQNSLLVKLIQDGQTIDALSSDFSMTGLRLRLTQSINDREPIELAINLPNQDLNQYERQDVLRIKGRVHWQRKDGEDQLCGVEFINVDESQRHSLKKCFEFYNKNATF